LTDSEPLKQIRHDLSPAKASENLLCSCKGLVLFYRHDLSCQIMILPYSHSLSVQSVARNGYGYIRTMQRWNSCGLWQKPLNCLHNIFTERGYVLLLIL